MEVFGFDGSDDSSAGSTDSSDRRYQNSEPSSWSTGSWAFGGERVQTGTAGEQVIVSIFLKGKNRRALAINTTALNVRILQENTLLSTIASFEHIQSGG